ncbi:diphthine--ammonia ligase [uncultured Chitinophaga sp.]|uniref:Dph6-related ATP pyrophosphatase n=1 Tax=uncultured Chitinophaga sp. TaxID=339340 RepID=UPI0025DC484E|nr:diphthine--ammonia ligase [uncultured Chitinophaga sp.]
MKTVVSWSGGKDSCFAMMQSIAAGLKPAVLLNIMNENGEISRSHALPRSILHQQAAALGLPMVNIPSSWQEYEKHFVNALHQVKSDYGVSGAVFGDIDLQAHRDWEEMVCGKAGLQAILPLWLQDRRQLVLQMLGCGISTMIVSCNTAMGPDFLGRVMNIQLVNELEDMGVDVCGENGEFHTVVVNCPLFNKPLDLPAYTKVQHEQYHFLKWEQV